MDFVSYEPLTVLYMMFIGFAMAFVDASVGGGGLISVPAYMSLGWPLPYVFGTNKVTAFLGLGMSTLTFLRAGKHEPFALKALPISFCAAAAGVVALHYFPTDVLRYVVVIMLVLIGIYTFLRKDFGSVSSAQQHPHYKLLIMALALVMGFYDGFFGPGSGSFYVFAFIYLGYSYVEASANAKLLTTTAMLGAVLTFIYQGDVVWGYVFFTGLGTLVGGYAGSRFVINHDVKVIRPFYLAMIALMIGKQVCDIFR